MSIEKHFDATPSASPAAILLRLLRLFPISFLNRPCDCECVVVPLGVFGPVMVFVSVTVSSGVRDFVSSSDALDVGLGVGGGVTVGVMDALRVMSEDAVVVLLSASVSVSKLSVGVTLQDVVCDLLRGFLPKYRVSVPRYV